MPPVGRFRTSARSSRYHSFPPAKSLTPTNLLPCSIADVQSRMGRLVFVTYLKGGAIPQDSVCVQIPRATQCNISPGSLLALRIPSQVARISFYEESTRSSGIESSNPLRLSVIAIFHRLTISQFHWLLLAVSSYARSEFCPLSRMTPYV